MQDKVKAGSKTDALVTEWVEPKPTYDPTGVCSDLPQYSLKQWWIWTFRKWVPSKQPSTNHAHAVEAMMEADVWDVGNAVEAMMEADVWDLGMNLSRDGAGAIVDGSLGECLFSETNGDKGRALALAICRAIVAAMKAEEARKEM